MSSNRRFHWASTIGLAFALAIGIITTSEVSTAATITPTAVIDGPDGVYSGSINLINSSGLSGTVGVGDDALKTHDLTNGGVDMWVTFGNGPTTVNQEQVTFTLGGSFGLAGTYIWNYNQQDNTGRGVHTFTIDISTDGTNFTPLGGSPFTLAIAGNTNAEPAQFLPFGALSVQKVRFNILTNYDSPTNGNVVDLVGLSEVRFATPEPGSIALLMVGLASAGFGRRRLCR